MTDDNDTAAPIRQLLSALDQTLSDLDDELRGPDDYLRLHQGMSRDGSRLLGLAVGLAHGVAAVAGLHTSQVLACMGLADEARCLSCGEEVYAELGSDWEHVGGADHDAMAAPDLSAGYTPDVAVRRIMTIVRSELSEPM